MAAQKLGLKRSASAANWPFKRTQKRAYIIADNRLALDAGWDEMLKFDEIKRSWKI